MSHSQDHGSSSQHATTPQQNTTSSSTVSGHETVNANASNTSNTPSFFWGLDLEAVHYVPSASAPHQPPNLHQTSSLPLHRPLDLHQMSRMHQPSHLCKRCQGCPQLNHLSQSLEHHQPDLTQTLSWSTAVQQHSDCSGIVRGRATQSGGARQSTMSSTAMTNEPTSYANS